MKTSVQKALQAMLALTLTGGTAIAAESEFCLTKVTPPLGNNCSGDDRSAAYFSWSTEPDGRVSVTITGLPGNTATSFRNTGMSAGNLKVAGKPAVTFTGAFANADKTAIAFAPSEPLSEGDLLTYDALVEYKTANAPEGGFALQDLWPTLSFTHTFGSVCAPPEPVALATPADIAVSGAGALTFTADANAGRHELVVYRGASVLPVLIQAVSSGDVIPLDIPGSYTLTLQSFSTSLGYLNSGVSERYAWTVEGEAPVAEVGETVFCSFRYRSGSDDHDALFTWETIDGNITISIAPVDESHAPTKFRGNGMAEAFTVNGWSGSWFTRTISDDKTQITLTPNPGVTLLPGDTVGYAGIVEYLTPANGNLYPTIDFAALGAGAYLYGSRCPQAAVLDAPVITGIDADGVITFTEVEHANRYALKVYRAASELADYSAASIASGSAIDFRTPGEYTVTVQAVGDQVQHLSSEPSERFAWTLVNESYAPPALGASLFCGFALDPAPAEHGGNDRAVFSWETRNSAIVVKIAPDEGNFDTYFRNDGMAAAALKVNGQSREGWFAVATNEEKSEVIFTPAIPLRAGDKITYSGVVEYRTGKAVDAQSGEPLGLWPSVDFGAYGAYLYGSNCAHAPAVATDKKLLAFSPDTGVATLIASAVNLASPLVLVAPQGLSVNPDTIRPDNAGRVFATPVEVRWEAGSSAGGAVQIVGGGLAFAKEIPVAATGFSSYCNKVLDFWGEAGYFPAYLSVSNAESDKLSFVLSPLYGETATWNDNSIQLDKVSVSRAGVTAVDRVRSESGSEITITFSAPLQVGDVVGIGPNPAFVWTAQNKNGDAYYNCYVDPLQTYTVGASCHLAVPHPAERVAVQSVSYAPASLEGGQVTVRVSNGDYAVARIRFWEAGGKLPYRELDVAADSTYEISGLEPYSTYRISVAAVDEKGYASACQTLTIKNLGTLTAADFPFDDTATYDGLPHEASFTAPERAGAIAAVLYNGASEPPVAVGEYAVTLSVLEGEGYHAAQQLPIGVLHIVRGGVGKHLLEYAIAPRTYSGEPHPVAVSVKPEVAGAGSITAVKYSGSTSAPVSAGSYAVTVDLGEGENFDETRDLFLDTLRIARAATTVEQLKWQAEDAVYSGLPHAASVAPADGVEGLGTVTLRYSGEAEAVNAGVYAIAADVAQGENYEAAAGMLLDTFTIGKATLTAERFTFPAAMPYDGTPQRLPVALAPPCTGAGEITVKYNGSEVPPVEIGEYAVSVSAAEGENFLATTEDIPLGSFSIVTMYAVTVQITDAFGYRMLSPAFTVTLIGADSSAALTASGQVIFENIPRHSAFTVSAVATSYPEDYAVSTSAVSALRGDTTLVLVATELNPEPSAVSAELRVNLLSAYVADNMLHVSPAVERVQVVSAAGAVALSAQAGSKSFALAHLPPGVYLVLLRGGGVTKTVKVPVY